MKHSYRLEGFGYRLRPIKKTDAAFIIEARLEDMERNQYVHAISPDVSEQEAWLERYFQREGDYYFVVENRLTGKPEGLISFYDEKDGSAEWGRWVIKKGSLAAIESVYLLYRIAFEQAGMKELYCRTISDNVSVVSFHQSIGEKTRTIHKELFELNGKLYDATEQFADKAYFYAEMLPQLEEKSYRIFMRNIKQMFGGFIFHHIGVATRNIERELQTYSLLGYVKEGEMFEDPAQGIRGQFIVAKDQPRLELLENLEGSHTLDKQLENRQKFYHTAYYVKNIDQCQDSLLNCRAKMISPQKESVYFKKRICFLMLPNMQMIELLEQ